MIHLRPGFLVCALVAASCGNPDPAAGSYQFTKAQEDSLLVGDYLFVSKDQQTPAADPCDPRLMPGYSTAAQLARNIANNRPWDAADEPAALALIDSFQHSPHHAFYSAVLLRSIEKADGYYAEPLGMAIHDDLLDCPCSLLSCCWENGCDGHKGLLLWSQAIAMEILIEHEDDPWLGFLAYGAKVEARAKVECDLQTGSRANEFLYEIGRHVKRAVERDSLDAHL